MNGGERGKFPRFGATRVLGWDSLVRSGFEVGREWNTTLPAVMGRDAFHPRPQFSPSGVGMNDGERGKFPRVGATRVSGWDSLVRSGFEVGRGWNTTLPEGRGTPHFTFP